jgi:glycosyltransferase involved in cell wall biosynthesis
MKITMLTESLGSGGAERQVCTLAGEFKRRGHQVCVATYDRDDFHRPLLEQENVEHRLLGGHGKFLWAVNVRRFLRTHGQEVVLAFLEGPSAYAELAGLPRRSWGLVVSERATGVVNRSWVKTSLHMLADYVTVNSHSARVAIERSSPRLRPKLITIYNAVQISTSGLTQPARPKPHEIRLIVPARLDRNKNPKGLLLALQILNALKPSLCVRVDWYGDEKSEPEVLQEVRKGITDAGLDDVLRLHPPTGNIHDLMSQADAVVLLSFHEGLPNAVCEGMMLGKPILMSDVCDARNLVQEGSNGFLFDPHSPDAIAGAIGRFAKLSPEERTRMGRASRAKAEVLFDVSVVADRYLRVLRAAASRKVLQVAHWPEGIPSTASSHGTRPRRQAGGEDER